MNSKIKNYVDVLFSDVPGSKRAKELKEELLSNMSERFDDYIYQGKSENQAYSLVVSNIGDIDEMLQEVLPDADFKNNAQKYRNRNARNTAISVFLYIIGAACLIGFGWGGSLIGMENLFGGLGLILLLILSAVATGCLIYTNMSTPQEFRDYDESEEMERRLYKTKNGRVLEGVMSIYWMVITFIYLGISFITHRWDITWIIWVLAGIFSRIIMLIFEMGVKDEK